MLLHDDLSRRPVLPPCLLRWNAVQLAVALYICWIVPVRVVGGGMVTGVGEWFNNSNNNIELRAVLVWY